MTRASELAVQLQADERAVMAGWRRAGRALKRWRKLTPLRPRVRMSAGMREALLMQAILTGNRHRRRW